MQVTQKVETCFAYPLTENAKTSNQLWLTQRTSQYCSGNSIFKTEMPFFVLEF